MDPRSARELSALPQPFVRSESSAAGIPLTTVAHARRVSFLAAPARGLYAVRDSWEARSPWERHTLLIHAGVRLFPDAIVSHTSQAVLLGLPHPSHPTESVRMTVLDDVRTSRTTTWCRFHRGTTPAQHIVIRHGIPGFIAPRVVLDCCREVHARDALAIVDGSLRVGLTSFEELFDMRRHQRRWPHVASSNEVLLLADGRRENWLESASAWSMASWGLPSGIPQVNVFTPDGEFWGRPDALWPQFGIVGEADGVGKYLMGGSDEESVVKALGRESVRQGRMEDLGLRFVRWGSRDAIDGSAIHARFHDEARSGHDSKITAVYRCSCCNHPLDECLVEAQLAAWRRKLGKEFEVKVW
ncbi:MAG: hypothetical protein ABIN90_12670 [Knoellia sp.]